MSPDPSDDPLRERFASLRERDAANVPELDVLLRRATQPERRPRPMPVPALAGAVACAVAVLAASAWLWTPPRPATPEGLSLALPGWRTPTDTLLPGSDGPVRPMPWADLPTAGLGVPPLHRSQERP